MTTLKRSRKLTRETLINDLKTATFLSSMTASRSEKLDWLSFIDVLNDYLNYYGFSPIELEELEEFEHILQGAGLTSDNYGLTYKRR